MKSKAFALQRPSGAITNETYAVNHFSDITIVWGSVTWAGGGTYSAAGQLTGLTVLGDVNNTCSGTSEGYIVEAWQYNS